VPTIDTSVPIPKRGNIKYPFSEMDPGDSFFVPKKGGLLLSAKWRKMNHPDEDYLVRTVVENGVSGYRCWRIQ